MTRSVSLQRSVMALIHARGVNVPSATSPIAIAVGTYLVLMSVPAVRLGCLLTQPITACMVKVCSVPTNTFGVIQRIDMT